MNFKSISSLSELVEAFNLTPDRPGRIEGLALFCGVGETAVHNWIADKRVPGGWHYRLHLGALQRGYLIDPICFGIDDPALRRVAVLAAELAA